MLLRLPLVNIARLLAVLMLATIGLQAAEPVGSPLQQRHGSAFGAVTYEVTLATARTSDVRKAVVTRAALPLVPYADAPPLRVAALPAGPAPRPDSTGPPLRDITAWRPSPRAPPLS
jgi:hypothetical protein